MIIITTITLTALVLCWLIWGRDEPATLTLETKPPEGLDPMQLELAAKNELTERSLYAMIIFWVANNYLEINEERTGVTLKTYIDESEPPYAKRLFNRLFRRRKELLFGEMPNDWAANTMLTHEVKRSLDALGIYESRLNVYHICLSVFLIAWYLVLTWIYRNIADETFIINMISLTILLGTYAIIWQLRQMIVHKISKGSPLILLLVPVISLITIHRSQGEPLSTIISIQCLFLGGIFLCSIMEQRKNTKFFGRILGFKEYLKTAEYDQLIILSEKDAKYGIDLLPYAIIFDLSPEWAEMQTESKAKKLSDYNEALSKTPEKPEGKAMTQGQIMGSIRRNKLTEIIRKSFLEWYSFETWTEKPIRFSDIVPALHQCARVDGSERYQKMFEDTVKELLNGPVEDICAGYMFLSHQLMWEEKEDLKETSPFSVDRDKFLPLALKKIKENHTKMEQIDLGSSTLAKTCDFYTTMLKYSYKIDISAYEKE